MTIQIAAIIAVVIFTVVSIIQLSLALGAPWGEVAWGGKYEGKLPKNLRIGSLITIIIFIFVSIVVLDRSEIFSLFSFSDVGGIIVFVFAIFLALNTLGNIASRSKWEKMIMTPLSLTACICLFIVALGVVA